MISNLKKTASGIGGSQLLSFLALPIISRQYDMVAFGNYSLIYAYVLLFGTVASMRYELAVVIPHSLEVSFRLFAGGMYSVAGVSLCAGWFFSSNVGISLFSGSISITSLHAFFLIGTGVFTAGTMAMLNGLALRLEAHGTNAIAQTILTLATSLFQISCPLIWGASFWGLIWSVVFAQFVTILLIVWLLLRRNAFSVEHCTLYSILAALYQYVSYPIYAVPYTLCGSARERGIILLMDRFIDVGLLGCFSMLQRILNVPTIFVSNTLRPILFAHAARHGSKAMESHVHAAINLLLITSSPVLAFALACVPVILPVFLGASWQPAIALVPAMVWPSYTMLLVNWLDRLLVVNNKQRASLIMVALFTLCTLFVVWYTLKSGLAFSIVLWFLSLVLVLFNLSYGAMAFISSGYRFRPLLRGLCSALVYGFLVYFISCLAVEILSAVPAVCVSLLFAGVAYFVMRNDIRYYMSLISGLHSSIKP